MRPLLLTLLTLLATAIATADAPAPALAEDFRVATWNVSFWQQNFEGFALSQKLRVPTPEQREEILRRRNEDDEDNWEVAQVLLDKAFAPDVLVVQEAPRQADLEFFNRRWLGRAYATVVVFPTNTDREQHLALLLKPGFVVEKRRDQYHLEKDSVPNDRGDRLFARGPAFCLVRTPSGYRFWVGVTHNKSKVDNDEPGTRWRNRESARLHQILLELQKEGPDDVILLGDLNDALGMDAAEKKLGQDAIATLLGPPEAGLTLVTEPLARAGAISFHGRWKTDHRELIDHAVVTRPMKDQVRDVRVFSGSLAAVASDHYPVYVDLRADPIPAPAAAPAR